MREPDESELQYIWRLCSEKDTGVIDLTWEELAEVFNKSFAKEKGRVLTESAYRKKYQQAKAFYDGVFSKMISNEYSDEIESRRRELQKERYKLQTEKLEYNRWLRENARDELFEEKVVQSIANNVRNLPSPAPIKVTRNKRSGALCLADSHFGKVFKIHGLFGEVLNAYSPEVFYSRMEQIFAETLSTIEREGFSEIRVYNLGDSVEGFIRNSQIWSLQWGVIDSATIYGNFMGDWLKRLSEKVYIHYFQTDGNHDELRLLDGKKGQHLCESAGKIVKNCIILKNENNPNFKYVENKTGLIFDNICGFNILGIHGEVRSLSNAISEYNNIYDTKISYLIGGHKHHNEFVGCGVRKGCIGVGSIIGSDDFSMLIRKCADATASLIVFEEEKGKVAEYTYVLN